MKPLPLILLVLASHAATVDAIARFRIERSKDGFGMRSHGIIEKIGPNRTTFHTLPQSTAREYIRLRPKDFRLNPFKPEDYERQEVIGPHQIVGEEIWFGNNYYDGEGMRGVGAFGYFDTSTCKYTLFSPPEVAPYEVSAILVQPEVVWVALDHFGEDISTSPGGLISWDRTTHDVRRYQVEFVVTGMRAQGDALRLATHGGYALIRNGEIHRYSESGRPIKKFPPPSSKW